jgi:hypothetical protein
VRLPDLLVAVGVIRPETAVEIFEAQALFGGGFDTHLLEPGILDEAGLQLYLERAAGVVNRVDVMTGVAGAEALARVPAQLAGELQVAPFRVVGRTLDVVCADPSDLRALDQIGFTAGCRLAVNIATEARVAYHLAKGYGLPVPDRLAAILAGKTVPKLVRMRSAAPEPRLDARPLPRAPEAAESVTERVLRAEPEDLAPPLPERDRPQTERELAQRLAAASERDEVPPIVLGFLADVPRVVLLRAIKKAELAGWDARGDLLRHRVRELVVPLDRPSIFAAVCGDVTPFEGPLARGPVEAAFIETLGGSGWPAEALLIPVRVKGRVVVLFYADAAQPGGLAGRREAIAAAARHVAETLVRIILAKKTS